MLARRLTTIVPAMTLDAAGGLLGALAGLGIPESAARYFEAGLRAGQVLVTVEAGARVLEARADRAQMANRPLTDTAGRGDLEEGVRDAPALSVSRARGATGGRVVGCGSLSPPGRRAPATADATAGGSPGAEGPGRRPPLGGESPGAVGHPSDVGTCDE
jgi:hypothetical protein